MQRGTLTDVFDEIITLETAEETRRDFGGESLVERVNICLT